MNVNPGPAVESSAKHAVLTCPVKVTTADPGTGTLPSLMSTAVYVTTSATPSVAVNWIWPLALVTLGLGTFTID